MHSEETITVDFVGECRPSEEQDRESAMNEDYCDAEDVVADANRYRKSTVTFRHEAHPEQQYNHQHVQQSDLCSPVRFRI
ncbi:unnamed protein product [Anisakis simplex]|uniref:Uncharacterized protein n=1 Tax=Anisakis simplex TaxID=6269 RepID=A0A0M3K9L6_ANISI|nr:unnamed protein product [Anisakis simplex]